MLWFSASSLFPRANNFKICPTLKALATPSKKDLCGRPCLYTFLLPCVCLYAATHRS